MLRILGDFGDNCCQETDLARDTTNVKLGLVMKKKQPLDLAKEDTFLRGYGIGGYNHSICFTCSFVVDLFHFWHSCLAVLTRSLSVNLTLQVWKSG